MVAQFEHRTTPMYYTLQALLSSIHRSESVPLVVEIPRIEHPYEGLTNETCFLALVFNKVSTDDFLVRVAGTARDDCLPTGNTTTTCAWLNTGDISHAHRSKSMRARCSSSTLARRA